MNSFAIAARTRSCLFRPAARGALSLLQNTRWNRNSAGSKDFFRKQNPHRLFSTVEDSDGHDFDQNSHASEPVPQINSSGSAVEITFHEESSVFHAAWLWCNDPAFIHPSSGQRLRSLGQYPKWNIAKVALISSRETPISEEPASSMIQNPPPPGCLHPIGSVYTTSNTKNNVPPDEMADVTLLKVTWDSSEDSSDVPEVSYYDLDWLRRCRYDDKARKARLNQTRIMPKDALGRHLSCPRILEINYRDVFGSDEMGENANKDVLLEIFHAIANHGAAMIKNAPLDPFLECGDNASSDDENSSPVAKVGRALGGGYLSHGALYGDVFHVQNMPNAHNIAYTPVALSPHQDLAYFESKPGLQLLQCIRNHQDKIKGGESTLVDAVAAAEYLREISPEHFQTLCNSHGTWIKQREGADMFYTRPFIVLGDQGQVVSVTWSPAFEGPPVAIPADEMEQFVEAYAAFERMLNDNCFLSTSNKQSTMLEHNLDAELQEYAYDFTWERNLEPGDMLIFNNQRMLHGRRGFELLDPDGTDKEVHRHLMGCYTNIDDTINTYRMLLRDLPDRDDRTVRCFGNGSSGSP